MEVDNDEAINFDETTFKHAINKSMVEVFSTLVVPSLDDHLKDMTGSVDRRIQTLLLHHPNLKLFKVLRKLWFRSLVPWQDSRCSLVAGRSLLFQK